MKTLKFLLVLSALFLMACGSGQSSGDGRNGIDGVDGNDGQDGGDTTTDASASVLVSNPSGKVETAFCKKGTVVWAMSVDASWSQAAALPGQIKQDDGLYQIYGGFAGPYVSYLVPDGTCYSETDNLYIDGVILRMMQPGTATEHNINGATSIEFNIAEDHFFNDLHADYGNVPNSFLTARSEVYSFFGFPNSTAPFYNFSVAGDSLGDAYLFALEAVIADGRSGPERNDYTIEISNAILENDLAFRTTLRQAIEDLPIKQVVENLKAERVRNGFTAVTAPIWDLPFYPDYYADLMSRTPTVLTESNLSDTSNCTADTNSSYTLFAVPFIFSTGIDLSRYLATNLNGNISIWTHGFDTYDRPGVKILDIEKLREILLESPRTLNYNGYLGDVQGLVAGTEYYIVIETTGPLSTSCEGGFLPFGRKLASNDDGVTWIGNNNDTPWWRKSGVILYTTD